MSDPGPADDQSEQAFLRFLRAPVREGRLGRRVHPLRVVLAVAAAFAVAWTLLPSLDELAFHFSDRAVVDVGDAVGVDFTRLPENSFVRASVILGNKGAQIPAWRPKSLRFGPIMVREVAGAPLFVEFTPQDHPSLGAFVQAEVQGRLVPFSADSELSEVVHYFESELGVRVPAHARALVLDERPGHMDRYLWAFIAGTALVVLSLLSLVRDARLRPIPDTPAE